jgi:histidine triad (HIT) family protein
MSDESLGSMFVFAKEVSRKIKAVFPCKKVGITVIGLEVPHAHIHLIPINSINDMNFSNQKLTLNSSELESIANQIIKS